MTVVLTKSTNLVTIIICRNYLRECTGNGMILLPCMNMICDVGVYPRHRTLFSDMCISSLCYGNIFWYCGIVVVFTASKFETFYMLHCVTFTQ